MRKLAAVVCAIAVAFVLVYARPQRCETVIYTIDEAGWTVLGAAEVTGANGYYSPSLALSLTGNGLGQDTLALLDVAPDGVGAVGARFVVSAWVNGDAAAEDSPLHISVGQFGVPALTAVLTKSHVGLGWKLVEVGTFENHAPGLVIWFLSAGVPQAVGVPATGRWLVDDIEIVEVEMRKWDAISSVVAAVKTINGVTDGFNIDLANRVYSRLFTPPEQPTVMLPYCCIPLDQEAETIEYEGLSFTSTWKIAGWAFLSDNPESDVLNSAGAESAAKFRDDLLRAIMADQSLGGTTINCEVASVDTFEGSVGDPTTWVQFTISFEQIGGAADLVPA